MVSETVLLLARHGATPSNLVRPYVLQGCGIDHDLDDLGVRQAEALSRELADQPLAAVYASPLKRSIQTAAAVGRPHQLEPVIVDALVEVNVGQWEGLSWDKIGAGWPAEKARHDDDPGIHGYPSGESFIDVRDRCVPAFAELARRHRGETFLVIGHNVVNRVCLAHWTGVPIRYSRRFPQNNTGYNVVLFREKDTHVRTINAVRHLSGLLPPD